MRVVRRHPLLAFVVLAYGLSWSWWIPMALRGDRVGLASALAVLFRRKLQALV